jgi:hypothetical protein
VAQRFQRCDKSFVFIRAFSRWGKGFSTFSAAYETRAPAKADF